MSLNIKNERVHALVREVAARTGTSQTSAVEHALQRYLDELDAQATDADRRRDVDELIAQMQRLWKASDAPAFTAEDLYDPVTGLPT